MHFGTRIPTFNFILTNTFIKAFMMIEGERKEEERNVSF